MTTKTVPMTRNIEVKVPFTLAQKEEMLKEISEAHKVIEDESIALKIHKDNVKSICEEKDQIIVDNLTRYRRGFDVKTVECVAVYKDGIATFTDPKTGEVIQQREITEEEQLQLTRGVDAEDIIRQSRKETEDEFVKGVMNGDGENEE